MSDRARWSAPYAILAGGLAAGTLDILAAFAVFGARGSNPLRILQGIASGAFGPAAFQGGATMAALGLGFHFVIATGAAAVYYAASRLIPTLQRQPLVWGPQYGIAVYVVMNTVVVPLSAAAQRPFQWDLTIVLVHMACVGTPIALAVRGPRMVELPGPRPARS